MSWFGYPLLSYSGSMPSSPTQVPTYCPHVLQVFWNFYLVLFAPLFILHVPPPTNAFQQLRHILTCLMPSFFMACYQAIFSVLPMQIHHQFLLLQILLIHNGVFTISLPSNIVGCLIYLWHLRKVWINVIVVFFIRVILCLIMCQSSYYFMACYYLDCVRLIL